MKLSKKTILIGISTLVVAGAGVAYYFITKDKGDVLGWMSSSWIYRKSVAVANSGSTLTNEDVLVTIDSLALVNAGKLQADCDDFRFTDSDTTTSLSYWIESGCNTTSTKIWVRIPSLTAGGKTIYMYYGNSSVASGALAWGGNTYLYADTTCPTGWTRASTLDGKYLYGSATYGTTGGSNAHAHTDATATSSSISTTSIPGSTSSGTSGTTTSHSHTNLRATVNNNASVQPPYKDAILCYSTSFLLKQGLISLFNATTPAGYTRFSALDNVFPKANSTYGGTGGSATHTHTTTAGVVTGAASGTQSTITLPFSASGGSVSYSGGYTIHTFTSSGTFTTNMAGYVDMMVVAGGLSAVSADGGAGGQALYYSSVYSPAGGSWASVGGNDANSSFLGVTAATGYGGTPGGAGVPSNPFGKPGGDGVYCPITGLYYGGGGGGGTVLEWGDGYYAGGAGGAGGGGYGGYVCCPDGEGRLGAGPGSPGGANTGGGGGGLSSAYWNTSSPQAGGSGVVIVRYPTPSAASGTIASSTHTHTSASATISTDSNLPPYLDMVFAKANSDQYVTENNVIITSVLPPLGWNRFTALDSKFARGAATYGGTGGTATHTHSTTITTGGPSAGLTSYGTGTYFADTTHTHSVTVTSDTVSNLPAYTTVIYAQRKVSKSIVIGIEVEKNVAPNTPTSPLTEGLTNPISVADFTPEFSAIFSDPNAVDSASYYQIQVNTNSSFTGTTMWDSTQLALSPVVANGSRSQNISYAGTALQPGTTYYWRIKFWDNNTEQGVLSSGWSATAQFSMNIAPTAPTSPLTEGLVNPISVADLTPEFSAIFNDPDTADVGSYYQIQVNTNSSFTGTTMWDSTQLALSPVVANGSRSQDISYAGTALQPGTTYYWRIKFWDNNSASGVPSSPWSSTAQFSMNAVPTAPTNLLAEGLTNPTKVTDLTPEFSAIYNDPDTADLASYYQIEVNTANDFSGTAMWDSTKTTLIPTVANGGRSHDIVYAGSVLQSGSTYYWRIKFWDNNNNEGVWSDVNQFTIQGSPNTPSSLQTNSEINPVILTRIPPLLSAIYSDPNGDDASAYQIQVNTNNTFTGTSLWDSGKVATTILSGARSSQYIYDGTPVSNTYNTYYWRIKFWDINDLASEWSQVATFVDTYAVLQLEGLKLNGLKLN